MSSNESNSSLLELHRHPFESSHATRPGSVDSDPFELDQSLWQSSPVKAPSTAPVSDVVSPGKTMSSLLGLRRSSAIEPFDLQQLRVSQYSQQYTPVNQFQPFNNYTTWSNLGQPPAAAMGEQTANAAMESLGMGMVQMENVQGEYPLNHQQQMRHSAPETGFFNMQRRHNSLDTELPVFNELVFDSSNPGAVTETTQQLLQCYQSVDFYFNEDPYKRVSITAQSMNDVNSIFEELVTNGVQLPRFSSNQLPSTKLILVSFKSGRIDVFYLPENSHLHLKINDLVVVEADRGRDLGKVLKMDVSIDEARLLKYLQHQEQQAALSSFDQSHSSTQNNIPTLHFPKPILRFAMPNEVYQILNKQSDEEKAKKICSLKIENSGLMMTVIDSEYQWDRRKLTFYYKAMQRIDFRELVKELFRIYKTRIWMCAVTPQSNTAVSNGSANGQEVKDLPLSPGDTSIWLSPQQPAFSTMQAPESLSLQVPRQFNDKLWN